MNNFVDDAILAAINTYNESYYYCKFHYKYYQSTNNGYVIYLFCSGEYADRNIAKDLTIKVRENSTYYDIKDTVLTILISFGARIRKMEKTIDTVSAKESIILPKNNLEIKKVIFNYPATIVLWEDGTKTVVKCDSQDDFDMEKGFAMAISKKALGNKGNYYNEFKKHINNSDDVSSLTLEDVRKAFTRLATNACKILNGEKNND